MEKYEIQYIYLDMDEGKFHISWDSLIKATSNDGTMPRLRAVIFNYQIVIMAAGVKPFSRSKVIKLYSNLISQGVWVDTESKERSIDKWIWLDKLYPEYLKVVPDSGIKVYASDKVEPVKSVHQKFDIYKPTGRYNQKLGYEHEYKRTKEE